MAKNRKLPCSPFFIGVAAVILIMQIPLPTIVLCILMVLNVVLAILIFFISIFRKKITDFSLFPTVLLASTVFGLVVNVFFARLIITFDDETIIQAAAALAAGSGITHLIIGCAGFIVVAAFLIIVITKCTTRVSETAARFVLNDMQIKIMAVETEYSSGSLTGEEAQKRKARILKESDFYGALDGAGKFISGSIKIAIFIAMVIILRGTLFCVVLLLQGESFAGVMLTYILLSIINGLYFLPHILLLSFAACLSVTRKIMTKMPKESPAVPVDTLLLELGCGLVPLVEKEKGDEFCERIQDVRRQAALDLGMVIPKVRILDNMLLEPGEYCIKIKDVDAGRGKIRMGYLLCINPGTVNVELEGEKTFAPAFGLPAIWISAEKRDEAERAGYTVVDPASIIVTHLTEIIKHNAAEFTDRLTAEAVEEIRKNNRIINVNFFCSVIP